MEEVTRSPRGKKSVQVNIWEVEIFEGVPLHSLKKRTIQEETGGSTSSPLPAPEQSGNEVEVLLQEEIRKIQLRHSLLD